MTVTQAFTIAYKLLCAAIILFLLLGSIGMIMHYRFMKGIIGLLTITIVLFKFKQEASLRNLLIVVVTLLIGMYGIGLID